MPGLDPVKGGGGKRWVWVSQSVLNRTDNSFVLLSRAIDCWRSDVTGNRLASLGVRECYVGCWMSGLGAVKGGWVCQSVLNRTDNSFVVARIRL